jgi:hypothetical protein
MLSPAAAGASARRQATRATPVSPAQGSSPFISQPRTHVALTRTIDKSTIISMRHIDLNRFARRHTLAFLFLMALFVYLFSCAAYIWFQIIGGPAELWG